MDIALLLPKFLLIFAVFAVTLLFATYFTYVERKFAAVIQDRIGPDRAGPFGLLQPLADAVKMFFKEDFTPNPAERFLFVLGPGIAMFTACMTGAVIPWGPDTTINGTPFSLQIADVDIGILYIMGFLSVGVYGIMIGGWASNNKYSLFGAIRASSQMISYELAMGLSIIAVVMMSGSLSLREIVAQQEGLNWNIWYQPVGFLIFLTCAFAECNRAPFDLPECETELVGGYHTEYSSMKLGFYLFAEYINMFISSAVMATLYFGGYNFPGMHLLNPTWAVILGVIVFITKILLFVLFFMLIRWTIPRFRYDQLMHLGWKTLIPLAILNMLVTGAVMLFLE